VSLFCIGFIIAGVTIGKEPTTEPTTTVVQTTTAPTTEVTTTEKVTTTKPTTTKQVTTTTTKSKSATTFKVTAYCACAKCCGKSNGITASGTKATQGRTIAADPRCYPYGTKIKLNGRTYVVEDCGGAIKGNRIDLYFDSHQDALNWGVRYLEGVIV
jgi:3D (Asp-Asp-Asp) domain-containing protein